MMEKIERIQQAVVNNDIETIRTILAEGIDIKTKATGFTEPLELAFKLRYQEIALLLINNGAILRSTIVHFAARCGNDRVVEWLLKNGYNPNSTDTYEQTPLHFASTNRTATILLAFGANVNAESLFISQPIHHAVAGNRLNVVKILLQHGADVNAPCYFKGNTPLHLAVHLPTDTMVKLLLDHGANVNARNASQEHPLHFSKKTNFNCAEEFLNRGLEINAQDGRGRTALHCAVKYNGYYKIYLKRGANINLETYCGETVFECIVKKLNSKLTPFHTWGLENMTEDFRQHIMKLKNAGVYVSKKNLDLAGKILKLPNGVLWMDMSETILKSFDLECEKEVNKFQFITGIMLSNFLTNKHPNYISDEKLCQQLEMIDVVNYSKYGEMIIDKFQRDRRKFLLLKNCRNILSTKSKIEPKLLPELWAMIFSKLSDADLYGVIAITTPKITKFKPIPPEEISL